jgi:hypothetical protein
MNWRLVQKLRVVEIYQDSKIEWASQCSWAKDIMTSQESRAEVEAEYIQIGPPSDKFFINPLTDVFYPSISEPEDLRHFVHIKIRFMALDGSYLEEWQADQSYGIATYLSQFLGLDVIFVIMNLDNDDAAEGERLVAPETKEELREEELSMDVIRDFFNTCQQRFPNWKLPPIKAAVLRKGMIVKD